MVRVVTLRGDSSDGSWEEFPWTVSDAPVHLALAHHLLQHGRRDFLIVGRGPLSGRPVVGAQVATFTAHSPQSGGIMEAQVEGPLAAGLFRLGIDAIVVLGRASVPSGWVLHGEGAVTMEESVVPVAASVWETDQALREDPSELIITTGGLGMSDHPAASIVVNNGFPTTQGGLGGVLGELGLKYLRCVNLPPVASPSVAQEKATSEYAAAIQGNPLTRSEYEAPGFGFWTDPTLAGYAGTEGFSGTNGRGMTEFQASAVLPLLVDDGNLACPGCPQRCLKSYAASSEDPIDGGRVHQLGIGALINQGNHVNPELLVSFNAACHDLGVEHLAAEEAIRGHTLSTEGLREAITAALTDWKPDDPAFLHVKGMPIPPFDPRGNQGLGLGFALNPTGPRYDVLEHDIDFDSDAPWMGRENLGRDFGVPPGGIPMGTLDQRRDDALVKLWLAWSGLDALGLCEFAAPPTREMTLEMMGGLVADIDGDPLDTPGIWSVGALRLGLLRSMNSLLGLSAEADILPEHFYSVPVADGRLAGTVVNRSDFDRAASVVRAAFGWSEDGVESSSPVAADIERVSSQIATRWKEVVS